MLLGNRKETNVDGAEETKWLMRITSIATAGAIRRDNIGADTPTVSVTSTDATRRGITIGSYILISADRLGSIDSYRIATKATTPVDRTLINISRSTEGGIIVTSMVPSAGTT